MRTNTCAIPLLSLLAFAMTVPTPAGAIPRELEDIERRIESLPFEITHDSNIDEQSLRAALASLQEITEAVDALPEKLRLRGRVRLAQAHLVLAESLMAAPCPGELSEAHCHVFRGQLAEHVDPLIMASALAGAMVEMDLRLGQGTLPAADRERLDDTLSALEDAAARLDEWATMLPDSSERQASRPTPQAPKEPESGWEPPPAQPREGAHYSLVWGNTELRRSPDDPEPIPTYDYVDDLRALYLDAVFAVEVLGESADGLLEVRVGGDMGWEQQCAGNGLMVHWSAVRVWIDPADRVEVLAAELSVDHADGTGLRLMPGIPLIGDQAWLNGQLVPVPESAERALSFTAEGQRLEQVFGSGRIPWTTEGTLGGEPFAVRQPAIDHSDDLGVSSWEPTDGGALVRYTRRCGEVRFLLDGTQPDESQAGMYGVIGGLMGDAETVSVPAGARLYWIDGRPAGQVSTRGTTLETWQLYGEQMRCTTVPVATTQGDLLQPSVSLCFRPEDLSE